MSTTTAHFLADMMRTMLGEIDELPLGEYLAARASPDRETCKYARALGSIADRLRMALDVAGAFSAAAAKDAYQATEAGEHVRAPVSAGGLDFQITSEGITPVRNAAGAADTARRWRHGPLNVRTTSLDLACVLQLIEVVAKEMAELRTALAGEGPLEPLVMNSAADTDLTVNLIAQRLNKLRAAP